MVNGGVRFPARPRALLKGAATAHEPNVRTGVRQITRCYMKRKGAKMAEDTTNENTTNNPEGTPAEEVATNTENTTNNGDESLGEGGIKALQAERKARAEAEKRSAEMAKRIEEFEAAQRTEAENLAYERDKALAELEVERKARADAERAVIAREVVAELGLPVELAGRIQGDDRESMMEDAKVFAAIAKPSEPSRPAPIGAVGNGNNAPLSTSELFSNAIKGVL